MDIGLFTNAASTTIPVGTDLVRTTGYSVTGSGAAYYLADSSVTSNSNTTFISANGRGFRISLDQIITPLQFGVQQGGADDTAPLQAFSSFLTANSCQRVDLSCKVSISSPITWGPSSGSPATQRYTGWLTITATAAMAQLIYFQNMGQTIWDAKLALYGQGSGLYSSRTCLNGAVFDNCGRMNWAGGGFSVNNFKFAGIAAYSNTNSYMNLGTVRAFYCGSGSVAEATNRSLQSSWSTPVNHGILDNAGQYTTVTVGTLPGADVTAIEGAFQVRVNGRPYMVVGIDRTAGTINLFPWLDVSSATSGTLDYIYGSAVFLAGADCNVVQITTIDAQVCGRAFATDALYGAAIKTLSAQACGTAIAAGLRQYGVHQADDIQYTYLENNGEDVVIGNVQNGDGANIHIHGMNESHNPDKWWTFVPRHDASTGQYGPFSGLVDSSAVFADHWVSYEKRDPGAYRKVSDPLALDPNNKGTWIAESAVANRTVQISASSAGIRRNMGFSGGRYEAQGTGPDGAPTGTITWTASGTTVNGMSSVAFSGFDSPAVFSYEYDPVSAGFFVRLLAGKGPTPTMATYDPPSLAAGALDSVQLANVPNVVLGDFVEASFSNDLAGARVEAWVSGSNTVKYRFSNPTASTIDLGSGTVRLRLRKS